MKTSILFNKHSWPASHVLRAAETEGTFKQRQNKGKIQEKIKTGQKGRGAGRI